MQKYDVTLKLLLQGAARQTLIELTGAPVEKWLNVELPKVQNPRRICSARPPMGA